MEHTLITIFRQRANTYIHLDNYRYSQNDNADRLGMTMPLAVYGNKYCSNGDKSINKSSAHTVRHGFCSAMGSNIHY